MNNKVFRKEIDSYSNLHDSRFETINRTPACHTMMKNTASVNFGKTSARKIHDTLLPLKGP